MYRNIIKPICDRTAALILLLLLLPVIILIVILLSITQNGKVFFTQQRPGKNEKIFLLLKFKTMNDKKDQLGKLLPDMERMHTVGRILRKSSLDEIPQLVNVLKGEMSFVGPRPLLKEYLPLYNDDQKRRHLVMPGITGWAQVNGRNSISWTKKFELDTWYTDHQSFLLDLKILFLTVGKIFKTSEINTSTKETMPAFNGNN